MLIIAGLADTSQDMWSVVVCCLQWMQKTGSAVARNHAAQGLQLPCYYTDVQWQSVVAAVMTILCCINASSPLAHAVCHGTTDDLHKLCLRGLALTPEHGCTGSRRAARGGGRPPRCCAAAVAAGAGLSSGYRRHPLRRSPYLRGAAIESAARVLLCASRYRW